MSDYTPKPGRGSAFKNTEADARAAYSGTVALPDGTLCFLDIYPATDRETGERRTDKNGNPWLNVSIKPKQSQGASRVGTGPGADQSAAPDFDDSDIPF